VEDWEQFFEEKSRRRADKVRRREQAQSIKWLVAAAILMAIATGYFLLTR
jgi:hypothetical protein